MPTTSPAVSNGFHIPLRTSFTNFVRGSSARNLWIASGVLLLGLAATVLFTLTLKANVEAAAKKEFEFTCNEIQLNIIARLEQSAQILRSGVALFDTSSSVSRSDWRTFTQSLQIEQRLPGIQGVGFSLLIPADQLAQHTLAIQKEGFPDYAVHPADPRDLYSSIIYLEPFTGRNLRAFGFDMYSEPIRRAAMEQARDSNSPALSGKVILVQETNQDVQAGTLMYLPVYRHGAPLDSIEQRRQAILGWVYSPFRMTDWMQGTLRGWDVKQQDRHISLQVYDGTLISPDTLLYDSSPALNPGLDKSSQLSLQSSVDFGGRKWLLRFTQFGGLAPAAEYTIVWLTFSAGTLISFLLFVLALSLFNTRANARRIALQLTNELHENEEKYSIIFNNEIYSIYIFDLETLRLLDANQAFMRTYGYSHEEVLSGMTIHDITMQHEDTNNAINLASREGTLFIPLRYHRKKDGTIFPVEIVSGPFVWRGRKVLFSLVHDITSRTQMEDALRASEAFNLSVLNSVPAEIAVLDHAGVIQAVNQPWLRFAMENSNTPGLAPLNTGVGSNYLDACPTAAPGDEVDIRGSIQAVLDGRLTSFSMEYPCDAPDQKRWFSMSVKPMESGEYLVSQRVLKAGVVISHIDITVRKQAEAELQEAHAQLDQRVRERTAELRASNLSLQQAMRAKDEFTSAMSHELRTPLTGILGLSQALQMPHFGAISEKQKNALQAIHESGERLLDVINDVLEYSSLQSGSIQVSMQSYDLINICQDVIKSIRLMVAKKKQNFHFSAQPEMISLHTDNRLLHQILVRLLQNASKFTAEGGEFGLEVNADAQTRLVSISVWDTGIGIKLEDFPRLFQPFVQLDARLGRKYQGTGLGLVLVKQVSELLGGSITVESEYGKGSRFTLQFPWEG